MSNMSRQYSIAYKIGAHMDKSFSKTMHETGRTINNVVKRVAAIGAAYMGVSKIQNFANQSVEAAKAQLEAETKLEAVLQNVKSLQAQGPNAYRQAAAELKVMASELQNIGVIGDEVTLAGMQQLATFQLSQKEIGVLSAGMTDLLAHQKGLNATQGDAVNIANMIGKAMDGQVGALTRVGMSLNDNQKHLIKTGDQMQRAAVLAEVIKQNVGGTNAALAETDQGKIQQMTMAWGDMTEEIGKKILPLQARYATWVKGNIPQIQDTILGMLDKTSAGIDRVSEFISKAHSRGKQMYSFVSTNWSKIEPIAVGIAAAMGTYYGTMLVATTVTKGYTLATSASTKALRIFNAVMNMSPLGKVALLIGVLVTAGWYLYKNWDQIAAGVNKRWNDLSQGFKTAWQGMGDDVSGILEKVGGIFKGYINIYIGMANKLIRGLNGINVDIPDWVPAVGGKSLNLKIKEIPKFARGGIATRPSIFGEAGPEMAIPLNKSSRALSLWERAGQILGAQGGGGQIINITYAPNINGGSAAENKKILNDSYKDFEEKLKNFYRRERRLSFA